jgi:hypothetical protein
MIPNIQISVPYSNLAALFRLSIPSQHWSFNRLFATTVLEHQLSFGSGDSSRYAPLHSAPPLASRLAALVFPRGLSFFRAVTRCGPLQQIALMTSSERIAAISSPLGRLGMRQQCGPLSIVGPLSVAANGWSSPWVAWNRRMETWACVKWLC